MNKQKLEELKKSLKPDEYIIPGHHPEADIKRINELGLMGTARSDAFIECYIQPYKAKRNDTPTKVWEGED